ncbi:helix-turn-helix transcriptional regulator [Segniliparus rugosus]|uniref:HTH cro/C1-type domain-containing protein n=1 Tax=Segniliparus rugosus (strain ATCC BAA-974 / DSM 45345 / CCUG 50838 / CIP 108380 / JCM 13579 / CDC 945) TaxID=679197 RepID=E5XT27_SEGRC|nr:helix-turn-helix transcriptional regulator [Segniliparus rugosus]EFV12498.1 hypothetical protein HMPREF9336_02649 [Segniliparus rugosus ATCC BAA-974]
MTTDDFDRNFALQVAQLRENMDLSQEALARQLREVGLPFHQATVQRIEAGARPVKLGEAFAIAQALGSTVEAMSSSPKTSAEAHIRAALGNVRRVSQLLVLTSRGAWEEWQKAAQALSEAWHIGNVVLIDEFIQSSVRDAGYSDQLYADFMHMFSAQQAFGQGFAAMERFARHQVEQQEPARQADDENKQ